MIPLWYITANLLRIIHIILLLCTVQYGSDIFLSHLLSTPSYLIAIHFLSCIINSRPLTIFGNTWYHFKNILSNTTDPYCIEECGKMMANTIYCTHCSVCTFVQVMNEVVVDRGPSPYITNLEVFCNGRLITTVQADGKKKTLFCHFNYGVTPM